MVNKYTLSQPCSECKYCLELHENTPEAETIELAYRLYAHTSVMVPYNTEINEMAYVLWKKLQEMEEKNGDK